MTNHKVFSSASSNESCTLCAVVRRLDREEVFCARTLVLSRDVINFIGRFESSREAVPCYRYLWDDVQRLSDRTIAEVQIDCGEANYTQSTSGTSTHVQEYPATATSRVNRSTMAFLLRLIHGEKYLFDKATVRTCRFLIRLTSLPGLSFRIVAPPSCSALDGPYSVVTVSAVPQFNRKTAHTTCELFYVPNRDRSAWHIFGLTRLIPLHPSRSCARNSVYHWHS